MKKSCNGCFYKNTIPVQTHGICYHPKAMEKSHEFGLFVTDAIKLFCHNRSEYLPMSEGVKTIWGE